MLLAGRCVRPSESTATEQSSQDEEDGSGSAVGQSVVQRVVHVQNVAVGRRCVERQHHGHAASQQSAQRYSLESLLIRSLFTRASLAVDIAASEHVTTQNGRQYTLK